MIYNLEQIELEEALRIYASFAKTEEGKNKILNSRKLLSREEIEKNHNFIRVFEDFDDSFLYEISEIKDFLKPVLKDNLYIFSEKELFSLLKRIKNFKFLRENLNKLKNPLLEEFERDILDPEPFEFYEKLFNEEGFYRKDATENLKKLYKKEKILFSQIQKSLEKEIEKYKDYLTEKNIMFKSERYCLPVKKSFQGKVEGVFWGISNSGETAYIEPSSILMLNNLYRSLLSEIELEKQKLNEEITEIIKDNLDNILKSLQILYSIDFYNALGKFKRNLKGNLPEIVSPEKGINLNRSYHPILYWLKRENLKEVVPLNLDLQPPKKTLILTGPNGGGKTIALKTVGLMLSLGLMGLPLTTGDGTKIPEIKKLFVSIGDSQDIEKGLSTFTSVISTLSVFLKEADGLSFCLIDEVGFGTNPEEGSALGISILKGLADKNSYVIATTHFDFIKFLSLEDERFGCGSMAFDEETGLPTFEFIKDLLGKSNAITIAEKFGLPKEIIEKAKGYLNKNSLEIEKLITKLQNILKSKEEEVEKLKLERENLKILMENIEREKKEERERIKRDFENFKKNFWEKLNTEIENLKKQGIKIGKKKEEKIILNLTPQLPFEEKKEIDNSFKAGTFVWHINLKKKGLLRRIEGDVGIVEIEGKNFWVKLKELEKIDGNEKNQPVNFVFNEEEEIKNSLNLIGKRVEDALEEIDRFFDNCIRYGLQRVSLIHGHGTGKLKRGIRDYLKNHPLVLKYGAEERDGATWVELKYG